MLTQVETQTPQKHETMKSATLRAFDYTDFRKFLSAWFSQKKEKQPTYSGAVFARQAGLSAHTLLGMVIRGDRNLSYETIRSFIQALDLKGREALYFEKLVLFNQAKKPQDKTYYLDQLHSVSQGEGRKIVTKIKNHARYFSNWYVVAVRELVATHDFKPDPEWIADRFKNQITRKQAQEAWELLLDLEMVKEETDSSGKSRYKIAQPTIDIEPGQVDFALRDFHRDFLGRSLRAVDNESLEERELSSLTMPVTDEDLPRLREKIREFRKQLNIDFPISKNLPRKHVVALNMQLLMLTGEKK